MLTIHWLVVAALMVFAGCVGVVMSALMAAASVASERAERAEKPFRIAEAYVKEHYASDADYELGYDRPESAVLYNGHPDSGSWRK